MIIKLKDILNSYTNEELKSIELWINSNDIVDTIIIDNYSINLTSIDINDDFYDYDVFDDL